MFNSLKNKQRIKSILIYTFVFIVFGWSVLLLLDDSGQGQLERLDILHQELTELREGIGSLEQSIDTYIETRNRLEGTLRELNELREERLEQNKELFMLLEQRIGLLQDILNDADLQSNDLTAVLAEIKDIRETLNSVNDTETADLAE